MKYFIVCFNLCFMLFFCSLGRANDIVIDIDFEELRSQANMYYKISSALFAAFTSPTTIAQGSFTSKYDDEPDGSFDVFKLPIPYYFNKESNVQPFFKFTYGCSKFSRLFYVNDDETPFEEDIGKEESLKITTHSFGLTTGIKWEYIDGFSIEPSLGITYSHIKHRQESDTRIYEVIIEQHPSLYRDYFDTTVDVVSISPVIRHSIDYDPGFGIIGFDLHYVYLYSRSLRSKSRYADISANSRILHTSLDYEIPTGRALFKRDIAIKPFIARTDFFGDVKQGMDLNHLYEYGMNIVFDVGNIKNLFSRLSVGGSFITGHEFSGWKFGVDFF
jgi:hypothetical protein